MFRNVADSKEWKNTTVTIYRIVFFHHLSRERISSQQDFGIKWQHKDLKSNGSTAGRTFLSAASGFAGQPGHLTGTHRRRKSVRFAAAAPPIRYHFRINYLPLLCREKYHHQAALDEFSDLRLEIDCAELGLHLRSLHFLILL